MNGRPIFIFWSYWIDIMLVRWKVLQSTVLFRYGHFLIWKIHYYCCDFKMSLSIACDCPINLYPCEMPVPGGLCNDISVPAEWNYRDFHPLDSGCRLPLLWNCVVLPVKNENLVQIWLLVCNISVDFSQLTIHSKIPQYLMMRPEYLKWWIFMAWHLKG